MSTERLVHRLSTAGIAAVVGALVLVGLLVAPAEAAGPVPSADAGFVSLLNTLRSTLGLPTLAADPQLSAVAQTWSANMARTGTLAHNGDLRNQVSGWAKLGENVGTGDAVSQIFTALVASPPHLHNMSDGDFTRIGIGSVTDAAGRMWTTHVFERPAAAGAAPPAPAPTVTTKPTAPLASRAPAPTVTAAPTTARTRVAPTTAPPTTAVAPPSTTVAPPKVAATPPSPAPTAPSPAASPAPELTSAQPVSSTTGAGAPAPLLAAAAVVALVLIGAAGGLLRRLATRF